MPNGDTSTAEDTSIGSQLRESFSPSRSPDQSAQSCPLANKEIPAIPCNLQRLSIVEPKAGTEEEPCARAANVFKDEDRNRRSSPVTLQSGDPFQITASSRYNPPRHVSLQIVSEACCDSSRHPVLEVSGPGKTFSGARTSRNLNFVRPPRAGDDGAYECGLWVILNGLFRETRGPQVYEIDASDCGLPTSANGSPTPDLSTRIEVYPADLYEFSLALPALLKPDSLKLEAKTESWKTEADAQAEARKEREKAAREQADAYYQDYKEFLDDAGISRADTRKFVSDMAKKASGEDDSDFLDDLEVKLKQIDGSREIEAPIDDIIKLVRFIRNAEYATKSIEKWINNLQVGPGASFTIEVQFFVGKVKIKWGYREYIDERVYLWFEGSLDLDIIKLSADISVGFRFLGACDLLIVLKGEGSLGITCPEVSRKSPDDDWDAKIKPKGELKLTGKLASTLMWSLKGEVGIECEFKTDFDDFHFLTAEAAFGGTIRVKRQPVYRVITASCGLFGFGGSKTDKAEIIPKNDNFAVFDFS